MTERTPNRGDKLRKVLTASTVRSFVEAANWVKNNAIRLGAGQDKGFKDLDRVLVRNTSGVDLGQFVAVGFRDPIVLPAVDETAFALQPTFDVELATDEADIGKFGILLEPLPNGICGWAAASGVVQAYILKPEGDDATTAVDVLGYSPEQVGALAFLHPNPTGGAQVLWIEPDEDATAWEGDAELGTVWEGYKLHRALVRFGRGASSGVALFEMKTTLREGGSDAIGWKWPDRTTETTIIASPVAIASGYGNISTPFRGVAYGRDEIAIGVGCDAFGDYVVAVQDDAGQWYAIGGGRTHGRANVSGLGTDESVGPGGIVNVSLYDEGRFVACGTDPVVSTPVLFLDTAKIHCGTAKNASRLELWWDHQHAPPCWKGDVCAKPKEDEPPDEDDEDEDGDDDSGDGGDGVGSPGGDGTGADCSTCSGLPPGEKCLPTECCSDEETATITDCEHANPAYDKYRFEIEGTLCLPQAVKDAATVEHVSGCTWESAPVTADDPLTGEEAEWKWVFEPVADGTSWLRLYKDGEVYLQFFRAGPWCYRCAQVFEVFCPPSDCPDISARVCIRPICVDACAHSTTYEITSPGDEDAADSTVYLVDGENAAEVTTNGDLGCPDPPSRSTIFTYGTTPSVSDGAIAIDIFPETEYSPTTCGSALDFVNADVKARVVFDDTIEKLGVKYGVAVEQDGEHFVALMGDVFFEPESDACKYLGRQHLKAEDFSLADSSGIDPSTHPDFSVTAPNLKFGIARWVFDNADGDDPAAPGHKVGTIYDDAHIQLCYAPCEGDPAEFDCPESVNLTACIDGENDTQTVTITNSGDNSFNITGWSRTSGLNPALNPDVVPFPLTITADPPGTLAPGEEWEMTFTLTPGDEEWTGSGFVTIHTTIGDCTFPVGAAVLEECEPEEPCALFHDDDRAYVGIDAGTPLTELAVVTDFLPANEGGLAYGEVVACDTSTGEIVTVPGGVEFVVAGGGGAIVAAADSVDASVAIIQKVTGPLPANFAAKAVIANGVSASGMGIVYSYVAPNNWDAVVASFLMGAPGSDFIGCAILRQRPGVPIQTIEMDADGGTPELVGLHIVGGHVRVVNQHGQYTAADGLLNSGDVDHAFAEYDITNGGSGLGILYWHAATGFPVTSAYQGELCVTNQPGEDPIWEQDPPPP